MKQITLDDVKTFLKHELSVEWKGEILVDDIFTEAIRINQIINRPVSLKLFKGEKFGWFTFVINENQFKSVLIYTKNGQELLVDGIDYSTKWCKFIDLSTTKNA